MNENIQQILNLLSAEERDEMKNSLLSQPSGTGSISEIQKLRAKVDLLQQENKFNPGDIVRWKLGLKNRKYPKDGQPAYVLECLADEIRKEDKDPGSPYFREPLDIILACLEEDGDLLIFHYDSRRFELVK
ncbi:MAG: hypothetical protein GY862_28305 [Gammaproteobacteria bacterium]|nr:hypothetical protein [Gammaproteobacteria bacterium]